MGLNCPHCQQPVEIVDTERPVRVLVRSRHGRRGVFRMQRRYEITDSRLEALPRVDSRVEGVYEQDR